MLQYRVAWTGWDEDPAWYPSYFELQKNLS